jgi:hypothetical protein
LKKGEYPIVKLVISSYCELVVKAMELHRRTSDVERKHGNEEPEWNGELGRVRGGAQIAKTGMFLCCCQVKVHIPLVGNFKAEDED